jgi:beta-glucosidase
MGNVFPDNFLWGVATSSYQIEGAWNADGKGECNWDRWCHTPGKIKGGGTGDVAIDHYHRWPEDVDLMRQLGLTAYRFSFAWSRLQPNGRGELNPKGAEFYDRLLEALLGAGITPLVTLCHYDMPMALYERGGWQHRWAADCFAEYAEKVVRHFGDRVKTWATFNEPLCIRDGYCPGLNDPAAQARVAHHLLLAHGRALRAIKSVSNKHRVGLVCNLYPIHAYRGKSPAKKELAERVNLGSDSQGHHAPLTEENIAEAVRLADGKINRMFLDPIYCGNYPSDMLEGHPYPPPVEEGDMSVIGTRVDFLGVNYYSRIVVRPGIWNGKLGFDVVGPKQLGTPYTTMGWEIYPQGLRELLTRIQKNYGPTDILITENGVALPDEFSTDGKIHDPARIEYLQRHFDQIRLCLADGIPVKGYCVWTMWDNFEWEAGWGQRFGLVHVDHDTLARTVKDSGWWYRDFIRSNRQIQ